MIIYLNFISFQNEKEVINLALKTLFNNLRMENAKDGFGNMVAVANESAQIRDILLEEMEEIENIDLSDPDAEEQFKNEAIDEEEMEKLIDNIPESEIDDSAVATARLTNQNVPVDEDEYVGAPMESVMIQIDALIPESEEY